MDVHEEGVRRPAALLMNGVTVNVIEVHGHGTACAQGVTADSFQREALFIQMEGPNSCLDHGVDVPSLQGTWAVCGGGDVGANDVLVRASGVGHDVVDPAGQGTDRAGSGARGVVADKAATGAILLIGDSHGGFPGMIQSLEGSGVGDDVLVFVIEGDIAHPKLLGAAAFILSMACILTHPKQVVEGDS